MSTSQLPTPGILLYSHALVVTQVSAQVFWCTGILASMLHVKFKIGSVALSYLQNLNIILSKSGKDCIQCPQYIQNMYAYGRLYYVYMIPVYRLFPCIKTLFNDCGLYPCINFFFFFFNFIKSSSRFPLVFQTVYRCFPYIHTLTLLRTLFCIHLMITVYPCINDT